MPSNFTITGTVAYEPKGIGLKLKCLDGSREKTLEVLCFDGQNKGLTVGQEVHVTGDLGTKKTEYVRVHAGKNYNVYMTQLVAREVVPVTGDAQKGRQTQPSLPGATKAVPGAPLAGDDDVPF